MKMEADKLEGFEFSTEIAGVHSCKTGVNKKIEVHCKIERYGIESTFIVKSKGKKVMCTSELDVAVDFLNSIK